MSTETGTFRKTLTGAWPRDAVATVTMVLAVLSCYGVLALTLLLPLAGIRLSVDQAAWVGTIAVFTVLTVLAVVPGYRAHRSPLPGLGAAVGGGWILYALLINYQFLVELAGFLLLATAVLRDGQLRRRTRREATSGGPSRATPG